MITKTVRRTLTILKLTDGVHVIESTKPFHHPGASYREEARLSLLGIFKKEPAVYLPEEKARKALGEIIGGLGKDDLYPCSHFQQKFTGYNVEFHLVLAPLDQFLLDSSLLQYKKRTKDWQIIPLEEHPQCEKVKAHLKQLLR